MLKLQRNMLDWTARPEFRVAALACALGCSALAPAGAASTAASASPGAAGHGATAIDAAPGRHTRHALPLPRPSDIDALLAQAADRGDVVVALAMRPDCPFCAALVREQLIHLHRGEKDERVRVIAIDQASREPLRVGGRVLTPAAWLAALEVRAVPTVLFLGTRGELAERLVGYASPDFYNAYLEARIEQARARLASARGAR